MTEATEKSCFAHQTKLNCENVAQSIRVDKQNFKCIINLNTTLCIKKSKHKKKCGKKHRSKNSEEDKKNEGRKKERDANNFADEKKIKHHWKKNIHRNKEQHKFVHIFQNHKAIERIVPHCSRTVCWNHNEHRRKRLGRYYDQNNHHRHRNFLRTDPEQHQKSKVPNRHHYYHHHHSKNDYSRHKKKQTESRTLLSPISSSPLEDMRENLSLENVSDISLDKYDKAKPSSYTRPVITALEMHDTKLDTLIKRAKERERKLVEQSRQAHKPWVASTPLRQEYSSADFPMANSELDISFNSLSTVILATKNSDDSLIDYIDDLLFPIDDLRNLSGDLRNLTDDLRNPTDKLQNPTDDVRNPNDDLQNPTDDLQTRNLRRLQELYSPCSPNDCKPNMLKESDFKLFKVKNEHIEVYFPTEMHKINCIQNRVKRETVQVNEIPLPSPNYFEKKEEYTGENLCKIENIKSEFIDD